MSQNLVDQVTKFRDLSKMVAESFLLYYNKLEYTGFSGVEPYLSDEINKGIKYVINDTNLSKMTAKITADKFLDAKDFDNIFSLYSEMSLQHKKLKDIIELFRTHQVDI